MKNILKVLLQIVKKKYPYLNYIFHNQFCDINIVHLSQYWKSKNDYYNILLIIYTKNIYEFILNWNKNIEEKKKNFESTPETSSELLTKNKNSNSIDENNDIVKSNNDTDTFNNSYTRNKDTEIPNISASSPSDDPHIKFDTDTSSKNQINRNTSSINSNSEIDKKFIKKITKKCKLLCHPDKTKDSFLHSLFLIVTESFENEKYYLILLICLYLDISYPITNHIKKTLDIIVENMKNEYTYFRTISSS